MYTKYINRKDIATHALRGHFQTILTNYVIMTGGGGGGGGVRAMTLFNKVFLIGTISTDIMEIRSYSVSRRLPPGTT